MNQYATEGRRELFDLSGRLDPDVARYVLERDRLYALQNGTSHPENSELPEEYMLQRSMRAITNKILHKYGGLVVNIAKKLARKGKGEEIEISDLKQEGLLGLVRALELYDPEKGGFVNYARRWIGSKMDSYRKNNHSVVREPIDRQRARFRIGTAIRKFGEVDLKDISLETGINEEKVRDILENQPRIYSIDLGAEINCHPTGEKCLADKISLEYFLTRPKRSSAERIVAEKELGEIVRDLISKLPEREQRVILGQYFEEKTNEEIGREINISEGTVRNLQSKALKKFRAYLQRKYI